MNVGVGGFTISSITCYLEWPGDRDGLYRYLRGSHPACAHTRRSETVNNQMSENDFDFCSGEEIYFLFYLVWEKETVSLDCHWFKVLVSFQSMKWKECLVFVPPSLSLCPPSLCLKSPPNIYWQMSESYHAVKYTSLGWRKFEVRRHC